MHRGEPVAADLAQDLGVEPGEAFEQAVEISPETVVAVELVDQLKEDSGAETMDALD